MIEYHAINPIAFEVGPVKVHWYGIMYLIGFAAGWWLARLRAARPGRQAMSMISCFTPCSA